jgi:hypothetical protein
VYLLRAVYDEAASSTWRGLNAWGAAGTMEPREEHMRTILTAMLVAIGIGLLGASGGSAAPADGASLDRAVSAASLVSDIRYYRHYGRLCYSKCYREFVIGPRVCRRFC